MSRINTNIPSLVAQRVLGSTNRDLNTSINRLSTGLRINNGKDDPAGLIASEALRAEKVALQAAITNISRANNVIATAEGGLVEINKLLTDLEDLVDRSANEAGISEQERDANQLQIDSILASIDRFANTTEFQGRRLLSGELDYTLSGHSTSEFSSVRVAAANLPGDGYRSVTVDIAASAQKAELNYATSNIVGGSVTIEVVGNIGTETLTFGSGTTIANIQTAINQSTLLTGVSAIASTNNQLYLQSSEFGSSQFVKINVLDDSSTNFAGNLTGLGAGNEVQDDGRDATVNINGSAAITDGLRASARSAVLSVDIDIAEAFNTVGQGSFEVTGGGADFMISPTLNLAGLASLGIQSVTTGNLGATDKLSTLATGKTNALSTGRFGEAQRIVREAQDQISFLRGRLGAFQRNTLETTSNSLMVTYENTTAAESTIRETDYASETANLTRSQILTQAATNTLRIANSNPQNVLALLG